MADLLQEKDVSLIMAKVIFQRQPCSKKEILTQLRRQLPYLKEEKLSRIFSDLFDNCLRLNTVTVADNTEEGRGLFRYVTEEEDPTNRVMLKPAVIPSKDKPCDKQMLGPQMKYKSAKSLPGPSTVTGSEEPKMRITRSKSQLKGHHQFNLVIIGGGSGGLACAKEAVELGASVAVLDYVTPSPRGTTWGLGGTCVNVGCIPKKLMHHASLLGEAIDDAQKYGWVLTNSIPEEETDPIEEQPVLKEHSWKVLVRRVQDHIKSLNWTLKNQLKEKRIMYMNGQGKFVNSNTVKVTTEGSDCTVTGKHIVIATGTRPKYPDIPGASEYGITSDDLFSLQEAPGKTAIVGAGYIGLECAGFLNGLGHDVTLIARSVLGRFDAQMVELLVDEMKSKGIKFILKCVPSSVVKTGDGKLLVSWTSTEDKSYGSEEFNTVMFAVGRKARTEELDVITAGITTNPETGKIITNNQDQTNIKHIFAVGDVVNNKPELTPVAVKAGRLLAQRLFNNNKMEMDYDNVATTIFTPLEYSCVGANEEEAIQKHGNDNIEIYHSYFKPVEFSLPEHKVRNCYCKIIAKREDQQKVLGFHLVGPNAAEIIQGFAAALKCDVTMQNLQRTVGVHPAVAEEFTRMFITKRSGRNPRPQDCCF